MLSKSITRNRNSKSSSSSAKSVKFQFIIAQEGCIPSVNYDRLIDDEWRFGFILVSSVVRQQKKS